MNCDKLYFVVQLRVNFYHLILPDRLIQRLDKAFSSFEGKRFDRTDKRRKITENHAEQNKKTEDHFTLDLAVIIFEAALNDDRSPVKERQKQHQIIPGGRQPERVEIFLVQTPARMFEITDHQNDADGQKAVQQKCV